MESLSFKEFDNPKFPVKFSYPETARYYETTKKKVLVSGLPKREKGKVRANVKRGVREIKKIRRRYIKERIPEISRNNIKSICASISDGGQESILYGPPGPSETPWS
ncbi:hypothetical protein GF319_04615 [Candidatus Bathyarchaeota archaeon]|nr:hypothetical protein [Candidatus Bathyarchaeota archaeon]